MNIEKSNRIKQIDPITSTKSTKDKRKDSFEDILNKLKKEDDKNAKGS